MNQRKKIFSSLIVAVLALLVLSAVSFAKSPDGHGGRGNRGHVSIIDKDAVQAVIAETLGVTAEDLDAAKADRKSIATLAEEQGVALADVETAITTEMTAQVEQAVADEKITQEKADALLERLANIDLTQTSKRGHGNKGHGNRGHGNRGHGNKGHSSIFDRDAIRAVKAEALGLTVEDLAAAKDEGKNLTTLAEEQGVAVEDVTAAVKAEMTAQVEQALADETITQEKADALLERIANADLSAGHRGDHDKDSDKDSDKDASDKETSDTDETTSETAADDGGTVTISSTAQEDTSLYLPLVMAQ